MQDQRSIHRRSDSAQAIEIDLDLFAFDRMHGTERNRQRINPGGRNKGGGVSRMREDDFAIDFAAQIGARHFAHLGFETDVDGMRDVHAVWT